MSRIGIIACCIFALSCAETWSGGIHARFGWTNQRVRVVDVAPEGPAAHAGLLPGDVIVSVDGEMLEGRSASGVRGLLSGPVGTRVEVSVLRGGEELRFTMERAPYEG